MLQAWRDGAVEGSSNSWEAAGHVAGTIQGGETDISSNFCCYHSQQKDPKKISPCKPYEEIDYTRCLQ